MSRHQNWFTKPIRNRVFDLQSPSEVIQYLLDIIREQAIDAKVYFLIDEYDQA